MPSQELRDALFIAEDSRTNFKQIIAKRSDLIHFAGGRIKKAGSGLQVKYEAGLVLGFATSGADSGLYKPYLSSNTDGSQVAAGVLSETAISDDQGNGSKIVVIKEGELLQDLLIGLDSTAITNMNAKSYSEDGVNIISIRA